MTIARKITHRSESVKGRTRNAIGRITGNRRMQARGRREQVKASAKQAGGDIKDAFRRRQQASGRH